MVTMDWDLPEIEVDGFCGLGGAAFGIEAAIERPVTMAINHSPEAIVLHRLNHPGTFHLCQNVWKIDPRSATAGRRVGLLWASPDCTHHSRAASGKPLNRKIRDLPWSVIRWAKTVRPRVIIVENVEEITTWGPLLADDRPDPAKRGQSFARWIRAFRRLSYAVEHRILAACDYGSPTVRSRFFLIARCDGEPIIWPAPTHGPGLAPYRTSAECIDWSTPGHEVYGRLAPKTIARIERGIDKFVRGMHGPDYVRRLPDGSVAAAFLAQHNRGQTGKSLNVPMPTITTVDSHALVVVHLTPDPAGDVLVDGVRHRIASVEHRMLTPLELARTMGCPASVQLVGTIRSQGIAVGNAVCPQVAEALVRANYVPDGAHFGRSVRTSVR